MPVITYNSVENALTEEQKEQLIQALTNAVGDVLGDKIKANAWVILNESPEGNFAIGGNPITANMLKSMQKKQGEPS